MLLLCNNRTIIFFEVVKTLTRYFLFHPIMKKFYRILLVFTAFYSSIGAVGQSRKFVFQQPKMGSPFNIVIYGNDSIKAEVAAKAVFLLVDTLNSIFSDYLPNSELNRLCATAGTGKWISVSSPLFTILKKSKNAALQSKGRFDVTISPITRIWRMARKEGKLPGRDTIAAAMKKVGYQYILLDTISKKIQLTKKEMQLDLGGIAKGETAQRMSDRLRQLGFNSTLVDAGGDIIVADAPAGKPGFTVAINLPQTEALMKKLLVLSNMAVTTSGDLYQYLEVDGIRYSHIIDPLTGWPLTTAKNVTVICADGTNADWITKACSILSPKKALRFAQKMGAAVQIGMIRRGKPVFYRSNDFNSYFLPSD